MPNLVFTTQGNAQVLAEIEAQRAAHERNKTAVKGINAEFRQQEQAQRRASSEVDRIARANETAQERYNRKLKEAQVLLKDNPQLLGKEQQRLRAELDKTEKKTGLLGDRFSAAFSVAKVTGIIGGFVSLGKVIQEASRYFTELEQNAQAAADRSLQSTGAGGELAQLFATPQEYQSALAEGRGLVSRGIFKPEEESQALDYVFALRSAGYTEEDRAFLAEIGEKRHIRPGGLRTAAASLKKQQTIFGGPEATGSLRDVYNKVIAASSETQSNVSQLSEASLQFGQSGTALGIPHTQQLAALVTVEGVAKDVGIASTQLDSLFSAVDKKGLKARGSIGAILDEIAGIEAAGGNLFELLGRKEAVKGYRALRQNRAAFEQRSGRITAAPQADILSTQLGFIESDLELASALRREEAEGKLARGRAERTSSVENLFEAWRKESAERDEAKGHDVQAFLNRRVAQWWDWTGQESQALARAAVSGDTSPTLRRTIQQMFIKEGKTPGEREHVAKYYERTNALLEQQLEEQRKTNEKLDQTGLVNTDE